MAGLSKGFQGLGVPLSSFQESQHRVQHPPIPTSPLGFEQIHPKEKEREGKGGRAGGNHLEEMEYQPNIPQIQSGKDLDPVDTTGGGLGGILGFQPCMEYFAVPECSQVFPGL